MFDREYTDMDDWSYEKVEEAIEKFDLSEWQYSPSQIKKMGLCPYQWALNYVCKMRPTHNHLGTLIGIVFHKIMEEDMVDECRYDGNWKPSQSYRKLGKTIEEKDYPAPVRKVLNMLMDEVQQSKDMGIPIKWPSARSKRKKILDHHNLWQSFLMLESAKRITEFLCHVPELPDGDTEVKVSGKVLGKPFRGYIDKIYEDDAGKKVVLDWKTTYAEGYFEPTQHYYQLYIYKYLTDADEAEIYAYFRSPFGDKISDHYQMPDYEDMEAEIESEMKKYIEMIENKVFPKRVGKDDPCVKFCPYADFCFRNHESPLLDL